MLERWKNEADAFGEEFESYSQIPLSVFNEIMERDKETTRLYVLYDSGIYPAVCMVNHAYIPNYQGPVLRVRHILFSPRFDLGDASTDEYTATLAQILVNVIALAKDDPKLKAPHIKFHSRSPNDIQFFTLFGRLMDGSSAFASVQSRGAWLYITLK
jgi:hypothetical protein